MGRSVTWALVGLLISLAVHLPLPVLVAVTVVTTIIGGLDWHVGEFLVAAIALASVAVFLSHPHHIVHAAEVALWLAMIPFGGVAALLAYWTFANFSAGRMSRGRQVSQVREGRHRKESGSR